MAWNRYCLGYHGGKDELIRKIVSFEETMRPSRNKYDWLGNGFYFWEDSPLRALDWARKKHGENAGVLGVVVDLGNCLDLVQSESIELVKAAYATLSAVMREERGKLPENKGENLFSRNLDCAVFEYLHEWRRNEGRQSFDTIRAFFVEGEQIYPTAGIRERDHVQICVRDKKNILGYFLPPEVYGRKR